MVNNTKNKQRMLRQAKAKAKFYSNVTWQLVLLGSMGLASFKLDHSVSSHGHYSTADYITIVAAVVLAVSAGSRIAQLISQEVGNERSE